MSSEPQHHLSALTLDSLQMGALPPEEERQARAHLAQCPACAERLTETASSAEHFSKVVQPRTLEQLRERMQRPAPWLSRPGVRWGLAVLAGVLAALGGWAVFR
ncbi:zf-HC2 domain-containing protein [Archangium sp.]|uniref:zf-HC2 domain-containing protein n=1 Tax=Archangium sp. TaxID=1872627 RepID=UPI00286AB6A2|nr:zf-HC2 domain-containing protein [Archangium sp.]